MGLWLRRFHFFVAASDERSNWNVQVYGNRELLINENEESIKNELIQNGVKYCEDNSVCKHCPTFTDKINFLRNCIYGAAHNSALFGPSNGRIRLINSGKKSGLQLRRFIDIENVTTACNRKFFKKQTNMMQLVTLNGPKIGVGKGTQLFLVSHDFLLPCTIGSVGMGADITVEYQIKQTHASCKVLAFNENVKENERLIQDTLGGKSYNAILTKPGSEEADISQIVSAVTSKFGKDTADVLFIRPYFTTETLPTFLKLLTAKKPDVCQLNVRIREDPSNKYKDYGIFTSTRKFIQNVFKTSWFLFHSNLRGHEQQVFLINVENLLCARKFFAHSCLPFDFV